MKNPPSFGLPVEGAAGGGAVIQLVQLVGVPVESGFCGDAILLLPCPEDSSWTEMQKHKSY